MRSHEERVAETKRRIAKMGREKRRPAAFPVGYARKQRADERDQQLQQVLNQLPAVPRFPYPVGRPDSFAAAGSTNQSRPRPE